MCSALFNYFFSKLWISLAAFSYSSLIDMYFDWEIEILDQGHVLFLRNACFPQWTMAEDLCILSLFLYRNETNVLTIQHKY